MGSDPEVSLVINVDVVYGRVKKNLVLEFQVPVVRMAREDADFAFKCSTNIEKVSIWTQIDSICASQSLLSISI